MSRALTLETQARVEAESQLERDASVTASVPDLHAAELAEFERRAQSLQHQLERVVRDHETVGP